MRNLSDVDLREIALNRAAQDEPLVGMPSIPANPYNIGMQQWTSTPQWVKPSAEAVIARAKKYYEFLKGQE